MTRKKLTLYCGAAAAGVSAMAAGLLAVGTAQGAGTVVLFASIMGAVGLGLGGFAGYLKVDSAAGGDS